MPLITHVFFLDEDSSKYVSFSNQSFWCEANKTSLVAVYNPKSILSIGYGAFRHCDKLETFNWHDGIIEIGDYAFYSSANTGVIIMNELPASLKTLGAFSFFGASNNIVVTKVPASLETIGMWAFWPGKNVIITDFNGSLKSIGGNAFTHAGENIQSDSIYIRKNVTSIEPQAFVTTSKNPETNEFEHGGTVYGNTKIKFVAFENPYTAYLSTLGLDDHKDINYPDLMEAHVVTKMGFNVGDALFDYAFNYDENTN